jgi:hypothetical protein
MIELLLIIFILAFTYNIEAYDFKNKDMELYIMNSNCSNSFYLDDAYIKKIKSKINFNKSLLKFKSIKKKLNLKVINAGMGTTATRSIHSIFCMMNLFANHYGASCNVLNRPVLSPLTTWYNILSGCIQYPQNGRKDPLEIDPLTNNISRLGSNEHPFIDKRIDNECLSNNMISLIKESIDITLTNITVNGGYEALSDTPVQEIYTDILSLAPNISVILSIRDSFEWATSRLLKHSHKEFICHPDLWDHDEVKHPFDFIGCMKQSKYVFQSLITVPAFEHLFDHTYRFRNLLDSLQDAYKRLNTYNLLITNPTRLHLICVWDSQFNLNNFETKLRTQLGIDPSVMGKIK